jgi:hypothetical protein
MQFAFHAAMIRDSLAELIHANHVDILKKVRDFLFRQKTAIMTPPS